MKSLIFIILLVFLILLAAIFSFSLLQFDPNKLRPQLEERLSRILHADVHLASISIQWGVRPQLEVQGLRIAERNSKEMILLAAKVRGWVRLLPLLKKEIWMDAFELESPRLVFLRRKDKTWNWETSFLGAPSLASSEQPAKASPESWKIRLGTLKAANAVIDYQDLSLSPGFYIHLEDVDIHSVQTSPAAPFVSQFEMPFAGSQRVAGNLRVEGDSQSLFLQLSAGSVFNTEIRIRELFGRARFAVKGFIQNVELKDLGGWWNAPEAPFSGQISGHWEGTGEGFHPLDWMRSMILKADLSLRDGLYKRLNVVERSFHYLSIIPVPGLSDLGELDFPLDFYQMLQGTVTPFSLCSAKIQWSDGKLFLDPFLMEQADYQIRLGGPVNLADGYADLRGAVALLPAISGILIEGVPVLEVLQNRESTVLIPIEYEGNWNEGEIAVDVGFIANRFVQMRGEELASLGIQKLNEFLEAYR